MSIAPTPTVEHDPTNQSAAVAGRFASEYLHALSPDQEFTARNFFDQFPDCARFKSVVLEVTLEEYVRRSSAGQRVAPSEIAGQFPAYRTAIARQIEVYQFLEESSGLEEAAEWPEPGDGFLGLQLRELLGTGAFSKVFLATEPRIGDRQVVVKVCRGAREEAAFLGRLGHPHITPIHWHQVCGHSGLSAIVMPFLARSTMADVIDSCHADGHHPKRAADAGRAVASLHPNAELTIDRAAFSGTFAAGALRWSRQLADALAFAHQHRICHSDIKPSNVLLTPAGSAVLVDFSMANDLAIDRKTVGGTFPYMAPEQLEAFLSGGDIPVSFATDLFSLGATLYEFLTGHPPFGCPPQDESRHATAAWLLKRQRAGVAPASVVNPAIPESLSETVMQCLAVDPERRPRSATALCAMLKQEASLSRRVLNGSRRHKRKVRASGAALVIAASFAVAHMMTRPPHFERELQQGHAALADGHFQDAIDHFTNGIGELPTELRKSPTEAAAWFGRGRALMESGDFEGAARDLAAARAIQRDNARATAALGFCEATIALRRPLDQTEVRIKTARGLFAQAARLERPTPALRFDLACLEIWLAINARPTPEERQNLQLRRRAAFDAAATEIDAVAHELRDTPNVDLLLARVEYERAFADRRRIDTGQVSEAANRFPHDPRILAEAAFAHALNASLAPDPEAGVADLEACAEAWRQAVQYGATAADWRKLKALDARISRDPRFPAGRPDETESELIPPDLLLNPLEDIKAGPTVQIAATGT